MIGVSGLNVTFDKNSMMERLLLPLIGNRQVLISLRRQFRIVDPKEPALRIREPGQRGF